MVTSSTRDTRDETLSNLDALFDETLKASLIVQLCALGQNLAQASKQLENIPEELYKELTTGGGRRGYLSFQWVSQSLLESRAAVHKINLEDFWEFVQAKQDTRKVYENHLQEALEPISNGTSGVKRNLQILYDGYPDNEVTSESLSILRQIKESTDKIEKTINGLLSLSPPAKRIAPSRIVVVAAFAVTIISLPFFYWLNLGDDVGSLQTVTVNVSKDVQEIRQTFEHNPIGLPKLILADILPMASNLLFLVSACLGVWTAVFSRDSRKDTRRLSDELTKAAKILREIR